MNALYWSFLVRHREKLAGNPRMGQMYRTWDKMSADKRDALLQTADATLAKLDAKQRL
jgi:deoxyribodipyrimidine photolyase-related protein